MEKVSQHMHCKDFETIISSDISLAVIVTGMSSDFVSPFGSTAAISAPNKDDYTH